MSNNVKDSNPQKRQIERIVMGQLKHSLHEHPEFFTDIGKERLSSIAKRIAGDVNAYVTSREKKQLSDNGKSVTESN